MQNTLSLVKDVRGCKTRFDPLTPEIVAAQTEDGLTYDELKEVLKECGMDIDKVVFDSSRAFQNAFYADFEQGHYCWIPFQKNGLKDIVTTMDQQFLSESFGVSRKNHEWTTFYMMDVPLPMQIYDFERRYKDIEPEQVFEVWSSIHTHIDYANGMWKQEVLEYVFSHAPQTEMPETDEDGLITIYRGMGEMSQDPANAISWSTDPVCALWFANRSGRGTRLVSAKVSPEQILAYNPGYRAEHEVILKPGTRPQIHETDMIPSTESYVPRLLAPVTKNFFRFGSIALTLGYPVEGLFQWHGIKHILRSTSVLTVRKRKIQHIISRILRQKGITMNDIQSYTTLKLELPRVAWYLGNILSAILGRTITCKAQAEDDSYWSVSADDDRFTNSEVVELVHYVGGDMTMIRHCIVPDANSSRSLDMDLCQALLKHVLKLDWEREFVTKDALWILGNWPVLPQFPELEDNMVFVDSRMIDCSELTPMAEFKEALFSEGGTFTDLTKLCEENEAKFDTPLYWMHPYTDGLHNGCYFVLVREGVLSWFNRGRKECADLDLRIRSDPFYGRTRLFDGA